MIKDKGRDMEKVELDETELGELRRQKFLTMEQKRIEQIAKIARPTVLAVGIGGAGSNVISWVKQRKVAGGKLISVNTDASHLALSAAHKKILVGEKITKGLGCGGYPKLGEQAMYETMDEVIKEIIGANIIFLVAGLGGGTGTGGTCALADELRRRLSPEIHNLVVGVVTLPFEIETARMKIAREGIKRLKASCDTVVVIDNNRLTKIAGNLPFRKALGVANTTIGQFIKGVTETIATASLINFTNPRSRRRRHDSSRCPSCRGAGEAIDPTEGKGYLGGKGGQGVEGNRQRHGCPYGSGKRLPPTTRSIALPFPLLQEAIVVKTYFQ